MSKIILSWADKVKLLKDFWFMCGGYLENIIYWKLSQINKIPNEDEINYIILQTINRSIEQNVNLK